MNDVIIHVIVFRVSVCSAWSQLIG